MIYLFILNTYFQLLLSAYGTSSELDDDDNNNKDWREDSGRQEKIDLKFFLSDAGKQKTYIIPH